MSLINQALKKAQRERPITSAAEQPSPVQRQPGELRPTHAETKPAYKGLQIMVGAGILLSGIVAAVALGIVLMQPGPAVPEMPSEQSTGVQISIPKPEAPIAKEPVSMQETIPDEFNQSSPSEDIATTTQALVEIEPAPQPIADEVNQPVLPLVQEPVVESATPAPASEVFVAATAQPSTEPLEEVIESSGSSDALLPEPPASATEPTPAAPATDSPSPAITEQPVKVGGDLAEPEPSPPPDTPLPGAEPNPKVLAFLESSRITGIKVAGVHSRLLMNNRVFRTDDIVHPDTQLRIKEIASNEILFVDESGIQYRKQFRR